MVRISFALKSCCLSVIVILQVFVVQCFMIFSQIAIYRCFKKQPFQIGLDTHDDKAEAICPHLPERSQ